MFGSVVIFILQHGQAGFEQVPYERSTCNDHVAFGVFIFFPSSCSKTSKAYGCVFFFSRVFLPLLLQYKPASLRLQGAAPR